MEENLIIESEKFVNDFCSNIAGKEMNESAKQVYFLDNHGKVKKTLELLITIRDAYEIKESKTEEETAIYNLTSNLIERLTETIRNYKNSYNVKPDVSIEDTTVVINKETITNAMENNSSTQALVKNMNEIDEKTNITQIQKFTHAVLGENGFVFINAKTEDELIKIINDLAKINPKELKLFKLEFTPVPLKTKTVYTL